MGGLWAYQEGSWGGWWDWDISEVFGLFIYLVFSTLQPYPQKHCRWFDGNKHLVNKDRVMFWPEILDNQN